MQGRKGTLSLAGAWLASSLLWGGCLAVEEPTSDAPYDDEEVELGGQSEGLVKYDRSCPSSYPEARSVATLAVQLAGYHIEDRLAPKPELGSAMLSSQFYKVGKVSGAVELRSTATGTALTQIRAALQVAQQDKTVKAYLVAGLNRCLTKTNGKVLAQVRDFELAASKLFAPAGREPVVPTCTGGVLSHCTERVWDSGPWCGQRSVSIGRAIANTKLYDPRQLLVVLHNDTTTSTDLKSVLTASAGAYTGSTNSWCSPFDGPNSQNPYLFIQAGGANFSVSNLTPFTKEQCEANPGQCSQASIIDSSASIDPVTYPFADAESNANGAVGTSTNPYKYDSGQPYAHANHKDKYAKRASDGKKAQFSVAYTPFPGAPTVYKWAGL